jgi:hypothetical protein
MPSLYLKARDTGARAALRASSHLLIGEGDTGIFGVAVDDVGGVIH